MYCLTCHSELFASFSSPVQLEHFLTGIMLQMNSDNAGLAYVVSLVDHCYFFIEVGLKEQVEMTQMETETSTTFQVR